jgi:hypothetical protein
LSQEGAVNAGAERRREDLSRLEGMCAVSGSRLLLVSRNGDPPIDITIDLVCRTAGSHVYPARAVERTRARITFPARYPFQPPVVHLTPVTFHPNVYPSGLVCLGFTWLPTEALDLLVKRIAQIITFDPAVVNTASPANSAAARWYSEAVALTPGAFPTDRLDLLTGTTVRPKPQWRDIRTESLEPAGKTIRCEKCPQQLRVPDVPGIQVRCPRCLHIFRVAA